MSDRKIGTITSYAKLDFSQVVKGVAGTKAALTEFVSQTKSTMAGLSRDVARDWGASNTLVAGGIVALGVASIRTAATMDNLKRGLTAVSGSSAETEKQLVRLREVAKLPGLGMEEAVRGSIRLQAAGLQAQLAERSLKAFGNALATVGGGKAELDGVNLALTQIAAKGKVMAEDINQLNERLPQIRRAMQDAFGTADTEKLQKMGLTATQFIEGIITQFEKLPPVTSGVSNSLENLEDASKRALGAIGESLLPTVTRAADTAADAVQGAADAWKKLPDEVKDAILGTSGLVATVSLGTAAITRMKDVITSLRAMLSSPLTLTVVVGYVNWKLLDKLWHDMQQSASGNPPPVGNLMPKGGPFRVLAPDAETQIAMDELAARMRQQEAEGKRKLFGQLARGRGDMEEQAALRFTMPADPALNSSGRLVDLQQRLKVNQEKYKQALADAATATTNAQRNAFGKILQSLMAEQDRLQRAIEAYDPGKIMEDAEKRRRQAAKTAQERGMYLRAIDLTGNDFLTPMLTETAREVVGGRQLGKALDEAGVAAAHGWYLFNEVFEQTVKDIADAKSATIQFTDAAEGLQTFVASMREQVASQGILDTVSQGYQGINVAMEWVQQQAKEAEGAWSERMNDYLINGRAKAKMDADTQAGKETERALRHQFDFSKDLAHNLSDEFADSFMRGLNKSLGKSSFGQALSRTLHHMFQAIMDQGMENLFAVLTGGTPNMGGPFGGLFKGIGKLLGFADGGVAPARRWSLVGERGPELIAPAADTRVVPLQGLAMAGAGGGGTNIGDIHVHLGHVVVRDEADIPGVAYQLAWHLRQEFRSEIGS